MENILENIKNILSQTGNNVVLPIIVSLITTIITNKINDLKKKKEDLPRFLLTAPCIGNPPSPDDYNEKMTQLDGYYRLQRKFDTELLDFLKLNGVDVNLGTQHIMKKIVHMYKDGKYTENTKFQSERKINEIIMKFKDNPKFIEMIKIYQQYENNSKWILTIQNVGNSTAYNFEINHFKESNSGGLFFNGDLECNSKRKIMIYYFDDTITVDNKNFLCMRKNNMVTKFYLVDKKKYNKKDEILFVIKYKDKYNKSYEQYCCACAIKKDDLDLMGSQ